MVHPVDGRRLCVRNGRSAISAEKNKEPGRNDAVREFVRFFGQGESREWTTWTERGKGRKGERPIPFSNIIVEITTGSNP